MQCCTQFRSLGVKILCALYLHYKVAFTFKWYGNSWNKTFYSQRVWIGYNSELAELVYHYFDIYGWECTGYQNLICSFSSCWQTFPKANYFVFTKSWSRDQLLPKKKKRGEMGSLGRGMPLRPENFNFCYPTSSPGCFFLAFATMFKTGDHFSWPLFLSFWVGGLARWNYSSNKIVCARHGQSWTPQPALESRPPKPCPVQRHILV